MSKKPNNKNKPGTLYRWYRFLIFSELTSDTILEKRPSQFVNPQDDDHDSRELSKRLHTEGVFTSVCRITKTKTSSGGLEQVVLCLGIRSRC
jgi:hypothetical protein